MNSMLSVKHLFAALFTTALVTSNVLASKIAAFGIPILGTVTVPAGFIAIAIAFLMSDTMAELYGEEYTRSVVNSSIAGIVMLLGLVYITVAMPAAPFYENSTEFEMILTASAPISIASVATILVSQNLDVYIFATLKRVTDGRHKWFRNIASTATSQLVDTTLFIVLGFVLLPMILGGTTTPLSAVTALIGYQYAVKVGVALVDTPVFYAITHVADES